MLQEIRDVFTRNKRCVKWDDKAIQYLGVNIRSPMDKLYDANYAKINREVKRVLGVWSNICLDFSSRIEIIKMNTLPRLLYFFQSLSMKVRHAQFSEWDRWISRFIWGGKKPRIWYETLQLSKDRGGLALPSL